MWAENNCKKDKNLWQGVLGELLRIKGVHLPKLFVQIKS